MAICFHRKLVALYEKPDGKKGLDFKNPSRPDACRIFSLPCGQCAACRVNKANEWATRAMHESVYAPNGCFLTLTYDDAHLPADGLLRKSDVQDFLKRLRSRLDYHRLGCIRAFFACGEYGTKKGRPHYHLLLLGWSPADLRFLKNSYSGEPLYRSSLIEDLWPFGFAFCGTVTGSSAAYVARYSKKGISKDDKHQPFFLSSRNIPLERAPVPKAQGALGAQWLVDNHTSLRHGYCADFKDPQRKRSIPDYYLKLMEKWYPEEFENLQFTLLEISRQINPHFVIADDHGRSSAVFVNQPDHDAICDLREYCGLTADDLCGLTEQEQFALIQAACNDKLSVLDDEQFHRLSKLTRNLH